MRHGLLDRHATPGERQELPRQLPRADAGLFGLVERAASAGPGRHRHARHRHVAHDRHQDVVEVVGDASGQQSERGELARLGPLFLHLERVGDVAERHDHADRAAGGVTKRRGDLFDRTLREIAGHEHRAAARRWAARRSTPPSTELFAAARRVSGSKFWNTAPSGFPSASSCVQPVSVSATLLIESIVPVQIGRDDAVADASQRDGQALLLVRERPLRPAAPATAPRSSRCAASASLRRAAAGLRCAPGTLDRCDRSDTPARASESPSSDRRARSPRAPMAPAAAGDHEAGSAPEKIVVPDLPRRFWRVDNAIAPATRPVLTMKYVGDHRRRAPSAASPNGTQPRIAPRSHR